MGPDSVHAVSAHHMPRWAHEVQQCRHLKFRGIHRHAVEVVLVATLGQYVVTPLRNHNTGRPLCVPYARRSQA
eukprot:6492168-Amphidinium_carterae.5